VWLPRHRLPAGSGVAGNLATRAPEARAYFATFADVHPRRSRRRMIVPDPVRSLRPKILERELLTERQLGELDRAARAHIEDPRTVMLPMLCFTAWGRKPG
jgi:hypothetical protein